MGLREAEKGVTVAQKQVHFGGDLLAAGLGEDGKVVAEEGEVIEYVVDLCTIDRGPGRRQLTDNALTDMIAAKKTLSQKEWRGDSYCLEGLIHLPSITSKKVLLKNAMNFL